MMPAHRCDPNRNSSNVSERAVTGERYHNVASDATSLPTSISEAGSSERQSYRRVLRYGRLFTLVNPPSQDELEETMTMWLPTRTTP